MSHNRYIYYSPNFEFRYINMRDNLTNISTSYLAFNDLYDSLKSHRPGYEDDFFSRQKTSDSLLTHYVSEMIRESDFILNFNSEKYIGESPTKLKVSINTINKNRLLK